MFPRKEKIDKIGALHSGSLGRSEEGPESASRGNPEFFLEVELGIDVLVIYPTLLLRVWTAKPREQRAICRAYNRWMGHNWSLGKGRLRWAAVMPLLSIDSTLEELHFAKEHGACGAMFHASEGDKLLADPYFFPVYAEATKLDLPICIHAGAGSLTIYDYYAPDPFVRFQLPAVGAFFHVMYQGLVHRFPELRWAMVEVTAQWLPYMLNVLVKQWRNETDL